MKVLAIEDSDTDFYLIERALGEAFALSRAATLATGLEMGAREQFDLLILDLSLGDSNGYGTFQKARAALPEIPVLILSGLDDEELALRAVGDGAQDYIRKSRLLDYPLDRAARYAIERRRFEEAARKSQRQYRGLFDNLPTGAFICDAEGLITYFNEKIAEIWGRAPKLNDPAYRFSGAFRILDTAGNSVPHDQSYMAMALREKKKFNDCEAIIELPSGERRNALVNVNPLLDENGTLQGGVAVLVDITKQRRAEYALRESERFARSIVNSLSSHIAILDGAGAILAVNAAWNRFAQNNRAASGSYGVGSNYLSTCERAACDDGNNGRTAAAGIRAVLSGDQSDFYMEYPCHSPTEERWFAMLVTPFEGDGPNRVVVTHENITARKISERLASEQCGLREAVAGMEQVLGVVGHELRTPLAALRAISEFLITDGARDTAEADRFLLEISQEVDRMSDTVNNLLEAARLNSGRATWNWSEIDLAETAEDAIASVQPLIDAGRVEVLAHIDANASRMLGDAEAIRRLLINLLSNARKHTTQGRIDIRAQKGGGPSGAWLELSVQDTGPGIPPELLSRLGEAFALNSGVVGNNHVSGTGLGLAICKGIAAAHGGELQIESVLGNGTTVTARLRADLQAAGTGDTVHSNLVEVAA